jgi:hypothetical protein
MYAWCKRGNQKRPPISTLYSTNRRTVTFKCSPQNVQAYSGKTLRCLLIAPMSLATLPLSTSHLILRSLLKQDFASRINDSHSRSNGLQHSVVPQLDLTHSWWFLSFGVLRVLISPLGLVAYQSNLRLCSPFSAARCARFVARSRSQIL